jgi:hypothetical protein
MFAYNYFPSSEQLAFVMHIGYVETRKRKWWLPSYKFTSLTTVTYHISSSPTTNQLTYSFSVGYNFFLSVCTFLVVSLIYGRTAI